MMLIAQYICGIWNFLSGWANKSYILQLISRPYLTVKLLSGWSSIRLSRLYCG